MKKKWLIIVIMLFFIGTCVVPSHAENTEKSSQPTSGGKWLYVGGSGPGNYTKIQDAIDNASDGDTVFVYDDSSPYSEHLIFDKSITLQGENKITTMINGTSAIRADNVILTDLMFWRWGYAVNIENFSNAVIENCVFNLSAAGIFIQNSTNDIIRNCSFNSGTFVVFNLIQIINSFNIEILYCDFSDSYPWYVSSLVGIDSSGGIVIHHCSFVRNSGFAVGVSFSRRIMIHHCNFTDNYESGVGITGSVVQLTFNNFINNSEHGVELGLLWSCDLRENWWGSPQGPSIDFTTPYSFFTAQGSIHFRNVSNGDTVNFHGITRFGPLVKILSLLPWRSEPVADAGRHL
jgi:parallel beta-helix repeat protein